MPHEKAAIGSNGFQYFELRIITHTYTHARTHILTWYRMCGSRKFVRGGTTADEGREDPISLKAGHD